MPAAEALTLGYLFDKAWILVLGLFMYHRRKSDNENRKRDSLIEELRISNAAAAATFVSEAQMKEAIREALEPYKEDQQEIKVLLRGLNDQIFSLSKDMAVQNALRSITNHDQQNNAGG